MDIICSEKQKAFREHRLKKTLSFGEKRFSQENILSEHIFMPNGGYCVYYPSNVFCNRQFENWGISFRYSPVLASAYSVVPRHLQL